MTRYRIRISSYADVEADSEDEALEKEVGSQYLDNQQILGVEKIE